MKKSKSVDSHQIADLFKEVPPNKRSPIIERIPGGSSRDDTVVISISLIFLTMLIGSLFVLLK